MEKFYNRIDEIKFPDFRNIKLYSPPNLRGYTKFKNMLMEAVKKDSPIFVYGDYDCDGLMCVKSAMEFFKSLRYTNYKVYNYKLRTHNLDPIAVRECIEGGYKYMIVMDCCSSDMDSINTLLSFGVRVLIIDHHETDYDYIDFPEGVAIINNCIENKMYGSNIKCSAGSLCSIVFDKILLSMGLDKNYNMFFYGLVSLYADCIDMANDLCMSIYDCAKSNVDENLEFIKFFKNEYININRRFIEYHVAPKINALFREERFDILNTVFIDEKYNCNNKEIIDGIHSFSREFASKCVDFVNIKFYNNFILADMSNIPSNIKEGITNISNYTGLVANAIAGSYGKACMVVCDTHNNCFKGSLRDQLSRNCLKVFKQFCEAGGHNPAFGFKISYYDMPEFKEYLPLIDDSLGSIGHINNPIIVEDYARTPNTNILKILANYNEFSGSTTPLALIRTRITNGMKEYKNNNGYAYRWGDLYISSPHSLRLGSSILAKPTNIKSVKLYTV